MRVSVFVGSFILFFGHFCYSQEDIRALKIGDTVPDIQFSNILNYPGGKMSLSDFRGKLVILDFWNIACIPCIKAIPKMEKLQSEFKDQIQILLVNTTNSLEWLKLKGFPDKYGSPILAKTSLPFVFALNHISEEPMVKNTLLSKLFFHAGEPFHVWIDQNGIVRALTEGFSTTEKTIQEFLKGKDPKLIARQDYLPKEWGWVLGNKFTDAAKQSILKVKNDEIINNIKYSSFFSKSIKAGKLIGGSILDSTTKKRIGIRVTRSLIQLYKFAYVTHDFPNNLVFLNVKNPKSFIEPDDPDERNQWQQENDYYYEIQLPAERIRDDFRDDTLFKRYLAQDLERFTGITASIERRDVTCLVLKRKGAVKFTRAAKDDVFVEQHEKELILRNTPFETLVGYLRRAKNKLGDPFYIDETGLPYDFRIDIDFKADLNNVLSVRRELAKYGIEVVEVKRKMKVLLMTEN